MAADGAHVFPGFLTPVLTPLSFQIHQLHYSRATAVVRGENAPESNFALNGYQSHNHQVISSTRSPLSQPGGSEAGGRANDGVRMNPLTLPAQLKT